MRRLFWVFLLTAIPTLSNASDPILVNDLYLKKHGTFNVSCSQTIYESRFTSWDNVPISCVIDVWPEKAGYEYLGSITIGADEASFALNRHGGKESYGGYTIEQRGKIIWELPRTALNQKYSDTPIFASDRAAFIKAMSIAAKSRGVLRLRFKASYAAENQLVDLEIPLRKWSAALRDVRRASESFGLPTKPWAVR